MAITPLCVGGISHGQRLFKRGMAGVLHRVWPGQDGRIAPRQKINRLGAVVGVAGAHKLGIGLLDQRAQAGNVGLKLFGARACR
jgi:hypothetical protein